MIGSFTGQNQELWGFSLNREEKPIDKISKVESRIVKKIVHNAYETDMEIHFLPHASIPFVLINTPQNIMWHYFRSEDEATLFRKNILIDGYHPYWQFI